MGLDAVLGVEHDIAHVSLSHTGGSVVLRSRGLAARISFARFPLLTCLECSADVSREHNLLTCHRIGSLSRWRSSPQQAHMNMQTAHRVGAKSAISSQTWPATHQALCAQARPCLKLRQATRCSIQLQELNERACSYTQQVSMHSCAYSSYTVGP